MPTYDYECSQCGHKWEEFQSITAKPLRKCPECGRLKAKRVIGAGGGIIFKGSGFYQTDYRSSSYKKDAAADSKPQTPSSDSKSSGDSSTSSKSGASDS